MGRPGGSVASRFRSSTDGIKYDEAFLEELIFANPSMLPIHELDHSYINPIPVCTQLSTGTGVLDALFVTETGRLVIVEAKLWRNPESRRKVVAQILEYAAELSNWAYEDLEREVLKRTRKRQSLFRMVLPQANEEDEARFVDSVTRSLEHGRFLLLICGDGIREGLGNIAEFIDQHTTLDFTFGLIEFAIFDSGDNRYIVHPRVLTKTITVRRQVITIEGTSAVTVAESDSESKDNDIREYTERELLLRAFWTNLAEHIKFDEPRQAPPNPSIMGFVTLRMPSPSAWITMYFSKQNDEQGLFLTFNRGALGDIFYERLLSEQEAIIEELPDETDWSSDGEKHTIRLARPLLGSLQASNQPEAFNWFQEHANQFVNVFRPRLAKYVTEL